MMKKISGTKTKILVGLAVVCGAGSAAAVFGGGLISQSYIGPMPASWFEDEVCFVGPIEYEEAFGSAFYVVDVSAVRDDGDPNTFARCRQIANNQTMICEIGLADGTVAACADNFATHNLPEEGDILHIGIDLLAPQFCDIVVQRSYGEADPKCRTGGTGGASGTGGGSSGTGGSGSGPGSCNASNADAVLTTGQQTTIASNACVQLKNETTWSTVDPLMQALPGTVSYPVPYSFTSCAGNGSGTLTGNWVNSHLIDGPGSAGNYGCDIFVKLNGNGSQVQFAYYQ